MAVGGNISTCDATVGDYLYGCVSFYVPEETILSILLKCGIESETLFSDITEEQRKLCEARLYEWVATTPSRLGEVSDSDNSWKHTQGGVSFTDADRRYYLGLANKLYDELGMEPVGRSKFKVRSHGICRANTDIDGTPLPHIIS